MGTDARSLARLVLAVSCAGAAIIGPLERDAHAVPESPNVRAEVENFLPMDSEEALSMRVDQLRAYVDTIAVGGRTDAMKSPGAFCLGFGAFDPVSAMRPMWFEMERVPRTRMLQDFAALVKQCGYGADAAYRAAFGLDTLYFNRLADTTGFTVADVLSFRNTMNELYVATILRDQLHISDSVRGGVYVEHPPDFLDAKPMSKIDLFRRLAGGVSAFSPQEQPVLNDFIQLVDLREGYLAPFGRETLKMMSSQDDLDVLSDFYKYENHVRLHPELLKESHGGWHRLMAIVHGDAPRAVRILGLLASVHLIVFRDLVPALARRGRLTPEIARAFYESALSYFIVNELDERSAKLAQDDHSLVYHFFFPESYETNNWKWYHWYNNAFSACELSRKGYPKPAIVGAIGTVAILYEGTELNMAIPWRQTIGIDPRVNPIVEGVADVRINQEGASYGADICHHE